MPRPKIGETGTSIYGVSDWAKTTIDYTVNWVPILIRTAEWVALNIPIYSDIF